MNHVSLGHFQCGRLSCDALCVQESIEVHALSPESDYVIEEIQRNELPSNELRIEDELKCGRQPILGRDSVS